MAAKTYTQRLEEVEVQVQGMRNLGASVQNIQNAWRQTLAILGAFIQEMGGDELDKKIHERLMQQQVEFTKKRQQDQKKTLDDLVTVGQLVSAATIGPESIVVLQESQVTPVAAADGNPETVSKVVTQEYLQMHATQLLQQDPKIYAGLIGQAIGFEYRDSDYELKVIGIYDSKKVEAAVGEPPPAADEPQAATETPTTSAESTEPPAEPTPAPETPTEPEAPATSDAPASTDAPTTPETPPTDTVPDPTLVTPRVEESTETKEGA